MRDTRLTTMQRFVLERELKSEDSAEFIQSLGAAYKLRSKQLHKAARAHGLDVSLMKTQEALAAALGFVNAHDLQGTLDRGRQESRMLLDVLDHVEDTPLEMLAIYPYDTTMRDLARDDLPIDAKVTESLGKIFLLCDELQSEMPLKPMERTWLEDLSIPLAMKLDTTPATALDLLAKSWAGSANWDELCRRTPLTCVLPKQIVWFEAGVVPGTDKSEGLFQWSPPAVWIWQNQLGDVSPDARYPEETGEVRALYARVMKHATEHPELLVAWTTAASIAQNRPRVIRGGQKLVRQLYGLGIEATEALIPRTFGGEISWDRKENRPYLHSLYNLRNLMLKAGEPDDRIKDLDAKLVKLDPKQFSFLVSSD